MSLSVAGAQLLQIVIDSRSGKCCILQYKMRPQDSTSQVSEAAVRDDDFVFGLSSYVFGLSSDVVGLSSNRLYIGGNNSGMPRGNLNLRIS